MLYVASILEPKLLPIKVYMVISFILQDFGSGKYRIPVNVYFTKPGALGTINFVIEVGVALLLTPMASEVQRRSSRIVVFKEFFQFLLVCALR